jgi:hypothetical protein
MKTISIQFTQLLLIILIACKAQSANSQNKNIGFIDLSSGNLKEAVQGVNIACDTLFSFKVQGPFLSGIAWDGENLWVNNGSPYVYKYSTNGDRLDSIPSPIPMVPWETSGGMKYFDNHLWLVGEQIGKLYKISLNGYIVNSFNLPSFGQEDPNGNGITFDGTNLWHSQYLPSMIYKINPNNGISIDSFIPPCPIFSLDFIDGILYGTTKACTNDDNNLMGIDTSTGQFIDTLEWCIPLPSGLLWDGEFLWGTSGPEEFLGIPCGGTSKVYMTRTEISPTVIINNIDNNEKLVVSCYPNPVSRILNCTIANNISQVEIYNIFGLLIEKIVLFVPTTYLRIDLDGFSKGVYFCKWIDKEGNQTINTICKI